MKHVNEKRTEEEFGYKLSDLKPNSEKLVYRICEICGKEELKKARLVLRYGQVKCLNCSNKINANINKEIRSQKIKESQKKNGHPRLGVKHTPETREKMSKSQKEHPIRKINGGGRNFIPSEKYLKDESERLSGKNNPFYGKKHGAETRARMSESAKKRAKRGKDSNFYGRSFSSKRCEYTKKDGSIIKMRSSWEVKVAKYLDNNNLNWNFEYKVFPVTYEYEGQIKDGTYTPDFFLDNGEIWEVKGYWRGDALVKYKAFKNTYPEIKITLLEKQQLIEMGIL